MLPWILFLLTLAGAIGALVWTRREHEDALLLMQSTHKDEVDKLTRLSKEASKRADRLVRASEQERDLAHLKLVRELLPALDALEDAATLSRNNADTQVADGLDMVLTSAHKALANHDVTRVRPGEGADFDPEVHEAVELVETDAHPDGSVANTYRSGWRHTSRVIRPAMVSVARAPSEVAFDFEEPHSSSEEEVEAVEVEVSVSRDS